MRIAVVGGGSTYTPELADGIARLPATAGVEELCLIDPAADRLGVIGPFAARLFARHGHAGRVTWTSDLDRGLDGADVVLIQLRVGGQAARISDETFPLACGCVGQETTGAGGLAKALRTVPVVLDVAGQAPERAWIVDFTNPVGIVTRALLDAGHRAVGLCNVAIGFQRRFAGLLGVDPDAIRLDHVGLNHLTWERAVYVDEIVAQERGQATRGQRVSDIEARLLTLYADPALDEKPDLLMQRGGAYYSEAAVGLIGSLRGFPSATHVANVRNDGTLPFLDGDSVIEVPCSVDVGGPRPEPVGAVGPDLAGLIAHVDAYERLAVDAALRGGRERVYRALLAHPLVGQHSLAECLTDRLLAANASLLGWTP